MKETSNQALVGTDAIKAFLENFGDKDKELNRIIVEELLMCLLKGNSFEPKTN